MKGEMLSSSIEMCTDFFLKKNKGVKINWVSNVNIYTTLHKDSYSFQLINTILVSHSPLR